MRNRTADDLTKYSNTPLDQPISGPITQGEFESIFRALKKVVIERAVSGVPTPFI